MKLIDIHVHTYPAKIAAKAMEKLQAVSGITPHTDGSFADTVRSMRNWRVDGFVPLNIVTRPEQQRSANDYSLSLKRPGVYPFGSVYPSAEDAVVELRRIRDMGLYGIKLHPDFQDFFVDDGAADAVYAACEELGFPILIHAGMDPISPDCVHAPPEGIAAVIRRFPRLKLIAAHLGGLARWDEVERFLVGSNVWLDSSMLDGIIDPAQARRIITGHGRVLFGSDCPFHTPAQEAAFLQSLRLGEALEERIFHQNAVELLGLDR